MNTLKNYFLVIFITSFVLIIASCGSGSGGNPINPINESLTVEMYAGSGGIANGESHTSVLPTISLKFNQPVVGVNATNVVLHKSSESGNAVNIGPITVSGNIYTFSSESRLQANANYYLVLSSGIKSIAGNGLKPTVFSFTTKSGLLIPMESPTIATPGEPNGIAVSPDGKFVYVTTYSFNNSKINQYSIKSDGSLHLESAVSISEAPAKIIISANGKFAYVSVDLNLSSKNIYRYSIESNGSLTQKGVTVSTESYPYDIAISPNGKFFYTTNVNYYGSDSISQYIVESDGSLTPMAEAVLFGVTLPYAITIHPNGKTAYVANGAESGVLQYNIGSNGALSSMSESRVSCGLEPLAITISPDGKNAYVANGGNANVSQYVVESNGSLTQFTTISAGDEPHGITITPDGGFTYVVNYQGFTISQYLVGVNGALNPMSPSVVDAGERPASAVTPNGKFLYVINSLDYTISQYVIN